jgi:predicted DNA-binding ribbon-helix-helix protein
MRTTVSLDDDAFKIAKRYAATRSLRLGKAISELIRRGIASPLRTRVVNGLHVVDLPQDSPAVTTEHVRKLEAEQ